MKFTCSQAWESYGVLVVAAIVVGWVLAVRRARLAGLDPGRASRLCRLMIVAGFAGAWLAHSQIYARGSWIGFSSFGGFVFGLAAGRLFLRGSGQTLGYLDAVAFVFPAAWMIGRTGCFLAHDHVGVRSESWLAVRFPGGGRFDLGLIEALFMLLLSGLFYWLSRASRAQGFFAGSFLLLYGLFRVGLDGLHESASPDGWFGGAAAVLGAALVVYGNSRQRGGQGGDSACSPDAVR